MKNNETIAGGAQPAERPVYELTIRVGLHDAGALDDWLEQYIAGLLDEPGFADAEVGRLDDDEFKAGRVIRFHVDAGERLQAFLDGPAARLVQQVEDRFGAGAESTVRALRGNRRVVRSASKHAQCLNCAALLTGQYCGQCGQRARSRLISLWELLRDAFGDLFDLDSRLWRTLGDLALHPGRLTGEYLLGRRARYLPPFRTYLVMSVLFFLVAFFDPSEDFGVLLDPAVGAVGTQSQPGETRTEFVADEPADEVKENSAPIAPPAAGNPGPNVRVNIEGREINADCNVDDFDSADLPQWLAGTVTRERVEALCRRFTLKAFVQRLLDILPTSLFVLLPLMALVLKLLYPLSRRYYVEHLLLVVHFHAFVFLMLTIEVLLSRLGSLVGILEVPMILTVIGLSFYIPVYLYKSLRRIYRQAHWLTMYKYLLLVTAYISGLSLLAATAALVAVMSV